MSESLGVPVAVELPCPMCGKPTPNLKSYRLGTFFFLVLAAASRTRIVTACPSCMREQVFTFAATNVVTFNVFWPFFILPLSIAYLIGSLRPGHSKGVIEHLRGSGYTELAQAAAVTAESDVVMPRLIGGLKIVLGAVLVAIPCVYLYWEWKLVDLSPIIWSFAAAVLFALGIVSLSSGVANLCLSRAGWGRSFVIFAGAAAAFAVTAGGLFPHVWRQRERQYADAALHRDALYDYETRVPETLWRPDALQAVVDWKIGSMPTYQFAVDDLRSILNALKDHHAGDPSFAPLIQRIEEVVPPLEPFNARGVENVDSKAESMSKGGDSSEDFTVPPAAEPSKLEGKDTEPWPPPSDKDGFEYDKSK